jgi:hypothetical protein
VREVYPEGSSNNAPLLRFAYQITPGIGGTGTVLGLLKITGDYMVRGRRATIVSPVTRFMLMSPKEKEELVRYLEQEKRLKVRSI